MQSEGITPPAKPNSFMLRRTLSYIRDAPVQARSGREVHYHILQAASATDKGNQQIVTKIRKDFRCHLCGFNAVRECHGTPFSWLGFRRQPLTCDCTRLFSSHKPPFLLFIFTS
jgi:hypothetical protein